MNTVHIAHDAKRFTHMTNYQGKALETILRDVKVRCIKCHSPMIRVMDLYDNAVVGYSCKNCSHYNLLNQNII